MSRLIWLCGWVAACSSSSAVGTLEDGVKFDPCAPLAVRAVDASTEQADGIAAGVELWRARGLSGLAAADATTTIDVRVEPKPSASRGFYDAATGTVLINGHLDLDTFPIVVAHELGHAFGLAHISDRTSVMNPGNIDTPPNDEDLLAVEALWGTCTP